MTQPGFPLEPSSPEPYISVVIPVYNEAENLRELVDRLIHTLKSDGPFRDHPGGRRLPRPLLGNPHGTASRTIPTSSGSCGLSATRPAPGHLRRLSGRPGPGHHHPGRRLPEPPGGHSPPGGQNRGGLRLRGGLAGKPPGLAPPLSAFLLHEPHHVPGHRGQAPKTTVACSGPTAGRWWTASTSARSPAASSPPWLTSIPGGWRRFPWATPSGSGANPSTVCLGSSV